MAFSVADTSGTWVDNNLETGDLNTSYIIVLYVSIVVTVSILLHSYQMHHDRAYTSVRLQTEIGTFCQLCSSILLLVCARSTNPVKTAVMFNFFANGLLALGVLLCDCYMFYDRLCVVVRIPRWKQVLVHSYIWILLVLPWFPAYSFIPIFYDTNDPTFTKSFYISTIAVSVAIVVYNFMITFEFTKILLSIYIPGIARSVKIAGKTDESDTSSLPLAKIKSVAIRSLGHCLTSSSGVFCYLFLPIYGPPLQTLVLVAGMHLWFNLKAGNAIGWLIDCCLRRKSIFPDGFFDSDGPEALRQQTDQGRPPDKRKDVVDMGSVKNTPNPKTAGMGHSSPMILRPPFAAQPVDAGMRKTLRITAAAGLVKMDEEESECVRDMGKIIPCKESSNVVAPTKSGSNMMDEMSKVTHILSGMKSPRRARMSISSVNWKGSRRDVCDSQAADCGALSVIERKEEDAEEKEEEDVSRTELRVGQRTGERC